MKKGFIGISIFLILAISLSLGYKIYSDKNNNLDKTNIKKEEQTTELVPNQKPYIDNNPIKLSLYKYYGHNKNREKVTEYTANWQYHKDISSFEVFFTEENNIDGDYFQNTFKKYYDNYENINNYKIGFHLNFLTKDQEINKNILSPKDTEDFFNYLEVYLYDDYHRKIGVWYSHTLENEMNDETLLTSIKLTAGKLINEITSDITVTVFTYDNDDFDNENNYRGKSSYKIVVKRQN